MKSALAVYTGKRTLNGRRLAEIASDSDISLRFLAMGGYLPGNADEIQSKALSTVNGGALLVVGAFATEKILIREFDAHSAKGDRHLIAAMLVDAKIFGHFGGTPRLPASESWPRCRICESEMIAFLELVVPTCDPAPFQPGSRLQIFACREHDEIAGTVYSDYPRFDSARRLPRLPPAYWNITDGHYLLRLLPPSARTSESPHESRLLPQLVSATPTEDDGEDGFKMYGEPFWLQDAEPHTCSCGAPMRLLLQIPNGHRFPMASGAEPQPNSFSHSEYCLFLGTQLYLLGCTNQCNPLALWPVLQD